MIRIRVRSLSCMVAAVVALFATIAMESNAAACTTTACCDADASCFTVCAGGACQFTHPRRCAVGVPPDSICLVLGGTYRHDPADPLACPATSSAVVGPQLSPSVLTPRLTLRCADGGTCVIDGDQSCDHGFRGYSGWTIEGFEVRNTKSDAITSIPGRNLGSVRGNYIHDVDGRGISNADSDTFIERNVIVNTGNEGILCTAFESGQTVRDNLIINAGIFAGYGISCGTTSVVAGNTVDVTDSNPYTGIRGDTVRCNISVGATVPISAIGVNSQNVTSNPGFIDRGTDYHLAAPNPLGCSRGPNDLDGSYLAPSGAPGALEFEGVPDPDGVQPPDPLAALEVAANGNQTSPSMVLLGGEVPAIAYFDRVAEALVYRVRQTDGTWDAETVIAGILPQRIEKQLRGVALAIDPTTGQPVVAWGEDDRQGHRLVRVARRIEGCTGDCADPNWTGCADAPLKTAGNGTDLSIRLAFDPAGSSCGSVAVWEQVVNGCGPFSPGYRISHFDCVSTGVAWTETSVADGCNITGPGMDLSIDPVTGTPHVVYVGLTDTNVFYGAGSLYHAERLPGGAWTSSAVPLPGFAGTGITNFAAMAHRADGSLGVAFLWLPTTNGPTHAEYIERSAAGTWGALEDLDYRNGLDPLDGLQMAFDPDGEPAVLYGTNLGPRLNRRIDGDWVMRFIDTRLVGADHPDLAFDGSGRPAMAYAGIAQVFYSGPGGADSDADGVPDAVDNCPAIANADQTDTDCAGPGDACANQPPIAACIAVNVCAVAGTCMAAASIDNGSSDPDGDALTFAQSPAGPYGLGTTAVTLIVDDGAATDSCGGDVTVDDCEQPSVSCPAPTTAECEGAGAAYVDSGEATASDLCSTVTVTHPAAATYPLGTTSVGYVATDGAGNASSCTTTVVVQDTTAPTITCPAAITAECSDGSAAVTPGAATASDDCAAIASLTSFGPATYPLGHSTLSYAATDGAGLSASCDATIQVVDSTPPVIACPASTIAECTGGRAANVNPGAASASDACSTVDVSVPGAASYAIGTTIVSYVASDAATLTAQCTTAVTVRDTTPPSIACPAVITAECVSGGAGVVPGAASASDVCGSVLVNTFGPATYPLGNTALTYVATDLENLTTSCVTAIDVVDTTPPSITCPAATTAECTGNGAAVVDPGDASGSDLCAGVTLSDPGPASYSLGTTAVAFAATDDAGNVSSCSTTVSVQDTTPPSIACPSSAVLTSQTVGHVCAASLVVQPSTTDVCDPGASSSCTAGSLSLSSPGVSNASCTATDSAGNVASCDSTLSLVDNTPPAVECPAPQTLECTGNNSATATAEATATDNCGDAVVFCTPGSGVYALGTTSNTCVANDTRGNSTVSCSNSSVTVQDTIAPTIACADLEVRTSQTPGNVCAATYTPAPVASDVCDPALDTSCDAISLALVAPGSATSLCTASDGSGNSASCGSNLTLIDDTAPNVACPAPQILECTGNLVATAVVEATGVDNCAVESVSCTPGTGAYALGTTSVGCGASDASGNNDACATLVTVVDTTPPVLACVAPSTVVTSAQGGQCSATLNVSASVTDMCDPNVAATCSEVQLALSQPGSAAASCSASDVAGNVGSCSTSVTLVDDTPPTIDCGADQVLECIGNGSADATLLATASDNCGEASAPSCTLGSGSYALGATTNACSASDPAGNTASCANTITVVDTIPPAVICPDDVTVPDDGAPAADFAGGTASDGCEALSAPVAVDTAVAGCPTTITRVYTVADSSGNSASCAQTITVETVFYDGAICPGFDDDLDGVPNDSDICPVDFFNDSDGDGSCDSDDPCPMDAADDADADGLCADVDLCPLDPDNDLDADGICGDVDACPQDASNDADGDGICGNLDSCPGGDDLVDADGDGTPDFCDLCPLDAANDADGDGICGDLDPCPMDADNDADGDGVCGDVDACPLDADNDIDGDLVCGDVDPCPADFANDADGDGLCESVDNCPLVANGGQSDMDLDGIGDACDLDNDGDGIEDPADNCPLDFNPDQADADSDLIGDVCDADSDGDGVTDVDDTCLGTPAGTPVLDNGCGVDQICPCHGRWKNHGAYEKCINQTVKDLRKAQLISASQARALRHASGNNDCGKTGRGRGHHDDDDDYEDESRHECRDRDHGHERRRGQDRRNSHH